MFLVENKVKWLENGEYEYSPCHLHICTKYITMVENRDAVEKGKHMLKIHLSTGTVIETIVENGAFVDLLSKLAFS